MVCSAVSDVLGNRDVNGRRDEFSFFSQLAEKLVVSLSISHVPGEPGQQRLPRTSPTVTYLP